VVPDHAISEAIKVARKGKRTESIVVTLSGRGDKDVEEVQNYLKRNVKD
jgi:tryptophan synthase beta chain